MANEEHVSILRQGVEVWNRWRVEHPDVRPDLAEADLQGIDFQKADLWRADLRRANLHGANLVRTNIVRANLEEANLEWTNLQWANLWSANLQSANLHRAKLWGAIIRQTKLQRSILNRAVVNLTTFAEVDLRGVQDLETVRHDGPSTLGIDTLYRSNGDIPEVFLRGCGVPDSMIEYARALVTAGRPIDYYSCFICYSSTDEALAERLYADLQAKGVRCWLAPHDLTPGEVIVRGIDEAIRLHDKVVLLLSEDAVTSPWVAYEVNLATTREAREGRTLLYPLRLDDAVLTTRQDWAVTLREGRHIGDFRQWTEYGAYQAVFGQLLRDLKTEQR